MHRESNSRNNGPITILREDLRQYKPIFVNRVSIAKMKSQFIAELEKLEPSPAKPHFMLKGQELEAKIKQFGIGKLKPKEMLASQLAALYDLL